MPTPKQKRAAKLLSENLGKTKPDPIGRVLQEAGYSKEVADNPKMVTESKGFKAILEQSGVTDDKLAKVMNEGLEANRVISAIAGKDANGATTDFVEVPDHAVRHKYMETGLKLRGHTAQEPSGNTFNFVKVTKDDQKEFFE